MQNDKFLKISVHAAALLPGVILAALWLTGNLTANPIQTAEQRTGDIAIILLLLTLTCTPLTLLTGWNWPSRMRRTLGLYTIGYALIHLLLLAAVDYAFNWAQLVRLTAEKPYILVGLAAFVILFMLAATSFDAWKSRLGAWWQRLHRLVYLGGILAVAHIALAVKGNLLAFSGDIWKPLLAGGVLVVLLVFRIPPVRKALARRQRRISRRGKVLRISRKPDQTTE